MVKKIKSFTVDEEIYKALLKMFKKYKVDVSLSAYVDGSLKELLLYLEECESIIESHVGLKEYKGLMGQMVGKVVFREKRISDDHITNLIDMLHEEEQEIEARNRNFTLHLYQFIRGSSIYKLSEDKKFMINKKTGERFPTFKTKDGLLSVDMRKKDGREALDI